jgi:hypothetical protein
VMWIAGHDSKDHPQVAGATGGGIGGTVIVPPIEDLPKVDNQIFALP